MLFSALRLWDVTCPFLLLGDFFMAGRCHCLGMDGVLLAAREHAGQRRRRKVGQTLAR